VTRRDPQHARVLGLWTAGWLAVFLLAGMFRLGEPSVQWPVLAVPLLWALVALRRRRRPVDDPEDDFGDDDFGDEGGWDEGGWDEDGWDEAGWDDDGRDEDGRDEAGRDDADRWPADRWGDDGAAGRRPHRYPRSGPPPAERTDTVERPALRRPSDDDADGRRRRY
jgi:hypothetical protein